MTGLPEAQALDLGDFLQLEAREYIISKTRDAAGSLFASFSKSSLMATICSGWPCYPPAPMPTGPIGRPPRH
jgi:hypothetical protein